MSLEKEKRHRKRVPVSCLNCKKRKVKCDKQRPCFGCVKNNVGHLCVYVEPVWADSLAKAVAEAPVTEIPQGSTFVKDLESIIIKQASEIKCLHAQLAQIRTESLGSTEVIPLEKRLPPLLDHALTELLLPIPDTQSLFWQDLQDNHTILTVLAKINPSKDASAPSVVIDDFFDMTNFEVNKKDRKSTRPSPLTLYSWLNIIRLDPQLTALWYKITNLQKTYHLYKQSLVKQNPQSADETSSESNSEGGPGCNHHTCPVVACEFNTMLEESNISVSREKSKSETPSLSAAKEELFEDEDALDMLTLLQKMWTKVKTQYLSSNPLTFSQLTFLVRFYFNRVESCPYKQAVLASEVESRNLLQPFYGQISDLFNNSNDELSLNVGVFASNMTDEQLLKYLRVKAVYMSMLSIIVEDAVSNLRSQRLASFEAMNTVSALFPADFFLTSNDGIVSTALVDVIELIKRISKARISKKALSDLLAYMSLLVATLNCLLNNYNHDDLSADIKDLFSLVFEILFDTIGHGDDQIQLWCDPAQIRFQGDADSNEKVMELRILFCQLWSDLIWLVNHVTINFVPILKHTKHLDSQLYSFLKVVIQVEGENTHVKFLSSARARSANEDLRNLSNCIQVNYLISRSLYVLLNGVYGNPTTCQTTISDLSVLASQISSWVNDISLTMLPLVKYFELRLMLHYLELFIVFVIAHQGEELGDAALIEKLVPVIFSKCLDINKFFQGSSVQFGKSFNATHVMSIMAEALGRMSHLIAGLLIRFRTELQSNKNGAPETIATYGNREVMTYRPKLNGQSKISLSVEIKNDLIRETDKTIYLLETKAPIDSVLKMTKIWKFYATFIRNSHKMNSESYAKLHSEAFKSGKLLSMCPVMPSSNYPVSATRTEVSRCPVAHSGMMDTNGASPIGKSAKLEHMDGNKRFCPVTHAESGLFLFQTGVNSRLGQELLTPIAITPKFDSTVRKSSAKNSFSFDSSSNETIPESRKRHYSELIPKERPGRTEDGVKSDPDYSSASPRCTPPLFASSSSSLSTNQQSVPLTGSLKQDQLDVIDWDSLPNFNFDFINDENLMMQVNNGDINTLLSEGLFS